MSNILKGIQLTESNSVYGHSDPDREYGALATSYSKRGPYYQTDDDDDGNPFAEYERQQRMFAVGRAQKAAKEKAQRDSDHDRLASGTNEGVAEGSLNEFAPDGFNGGDDGEEFNPNLAKMAYDEGFVKGASLADGATTQRAMAINDWDKHDGGIYAQHFAKGFKAGRMDKIRHNNKQYNLNLKLMKDGSIRHGEQGVAEGFGLRGTGNPGMPTPYDQGRADAKKGRPYDNPYDQPGEEQEHRNYRKGYEQGKEQGVAEGEGNFAGDTPFNLGGVSVKNIQVGDTVKYLGQPSKVVAMSKDRKYARITISKGMGGVTQDVLTTDLKRTGLSEEQLDELSPETLASYKKKAGADATQADKRGDYARGDKRMSGIIKATKKEFDNDAKSVAEGLPQTLRKVVPGHAKREIDKKMDAGKFGKTDADKDANFQRYKKIQDKLKKQGVAEGIMNTIANKVMGAAPEQPKYQVGQRVKYETSPHQPDWKDGGSGVGVITAYKNGHYMINDNPVNHFEIKGVVDQDVAEEKQRLDPSCWKGYKKQGTKMKGDTRVNNCVPVKESAIMKGLK